MTGRTPTRPHAATRRDGSFDAFETAEHRLELAGTAKAAELARVADQLAPAVTAGLGESLASGPFFKAYIANLVPGQFMQPFIDAAFSDLGLDPNVLAPSQLTDPQTGQPGTPALPVPYPRTGQGG